MKTQNENSGLTPNENLKTENELLKKKLAEEFGMQQHESKLPDDIENQWLNYIYNFEKSYAENKRIKIYDFIGKPEFRSIEQLNKDEITSELDRLLDILDENNVVLDLLCEYEDEVIYKFITEELFQEETDDMRIEGMRHHFIYEEFHPNHDYDLRYDTNEFFKSLFTRNWDDQFDKIRLYDEVELHSIRYSCEEFSKIISAFQKSNGLFEIKSMNIEEVEFCLESKNAFVLGNIDYCNQQFSNSGNFILEFAKDDLGYWVIRKISVPGF